MKLNMKLKLLILSGRAPLLVYFFGAALIIFGYEVIEETFLSESLTDLQSNLLSALIIASVVTAVASYWRHWTTKVQERQRIAAAAFETQQGMFVTNVEKVILRVNKAFTEITGFSAEEAVGQTPRLLNSGHHDGTFYAAMWDSIKRTGSWQGEIWNRRKNGKVYPETLRINTVRDATGEVSNYVAAFNDVTSYKDAEQQIQSLAFSDPLTGLPNRPHLIVLLQQALITSSEHQRQCALLSIDLDHFKVFNDTFGRESGNTLLQKVAKRLNNCVRKCDTVSRLTGNEFVVLLEDLNPEPMAAIKEVETVARKVLCALTQPYRLGNSTHSNTASIGITLFDETSEETLDGLLKQAELAMQQAKVAGRNSLCFFHPGMLTTISRRADLVAGLQAAVEKNQFVLHYQAQATQDSQFVGVEALLRWQHPRDGLVFPAEFIPLAEESELILPIGRWVLDAACTQIALWARKPAMAHLTVAVNVSAIQFHQDDFVEQVLAVLERTGAAASLLKLELTESLLISNVKDVIAKMKALKTRGIVFSLDDFGTGYSSLSYLKRLPLDQLKIDQSFVRDILIDPDDAAIAKMVIALADSLGLDVIAEGVETLEQRDALAAMGCRRYQGYFFSRPLPAQEFETLVARV